MTERAVATSATPSVQVLHQRWIQALAQYEMWTSLWADNPALADRAGQRVRELMMPLHEVQRLYAERWAAQGEPVVPGDQNG